MTINTEPVTRLDYKLRFRKPPGFCVHIVIEEIIEKLHARQRPGMGELHAMEYLLTRKRAEPGHQVFRKRQTAFTFIEFVMTQSAAGAQIIGVSNCRLVVIAHDYREIAFSLFDERAETVQLPDLGLGSTPELVWCRGIVRLTTRGLLVGPLVFVVDQIAQTYDLTAP